MAEFSLSEIIVAPYEKEGKHFYLKYHLSTLDMYPLELLSGEAICHFHLWLPFLWRQLDFKAQMFSFKIRELTGLV